MFLSEKHTQILIVLAKHTEGLSVEEIGERTGLGRAAVRNGLRALARVGAAQEEGNRWKVRSDDEL